MKTSLSATDLAHFERKLRALEQQSLAQARQFAARSAHEHFRDVASEAPDRGDAALADTVVDLNEAESSRQIQEIDAIQSALGRIAAGSYGVCHRCGENIERARLEAAPAALYDLHCQEIVEREGTRPPMPSL